MIVLCLILGLFYNVYADKPCAPRAVRGESVLCVCNTTYCDEISRPAPGPGKYVVYTTNKAGLRFKKSTGTLKDIDESASYVSVIDVQQDTHYQAIKGFGGAVTDAAGINWKTLNPQLQQALIDSYFSAGGLEYNFIRVPIGGSDFSTRPYTLNDLPVGDKLLSNFSLAEEDQKYKIPMIKAAMAASTATVAVVATTWSPPIWMKTNNAFYGFSRLKKAYYKSYADYHIKFLEQYAAQGVPVWALTTTNEPSNGVVPLARFNSLGWTPQTMADWIVEHLGPRLRASAWNRTLLLAADDQRFTLPVWFERLVSDRPAVLDWVAGAAVHFYGDFITPASVLDDLARRHPDKFILATEACEGSYPWQRKVILGSWDRAVTYIKDIIEDISHHVIGWIDWNLCLDPKGGPNWASNFVDSPVIVTGPDEFVKQPMFYAMGHFAKFVPRGSVRVKSGRRGCDGLSSVAFATPRSTVVVVIYNACKPHEVQVRLGGRMAVVRVTRDSIVTVEIDPQGLSEPMGE